MRFKKNNRIWTNNDTDPKEFWDYDDDNGKTTWYEPDSSLDSVTDTPSDREQEMNNEGY